MRTLIGSTALLLFALTASAKSVEHAPLGPTQTRFLGWNAEENQAAFEMTLPARDASQTPFRIVQVVATSSHTVVATFRGGGHETPGNPAPEAWHRAEPNVAWQKSSRRSHFVAKSFAFPDSTIRLKAISHARLHVRAATDRLEIGADASEAMNFEAVARLMDGSEASLGVFLQPCARNEQLHGALGVYRSQTGRHLLVLVDIWDAQGHVVDQDARLVALTPAPLGHNQIGMRRAYGEIARGVRQIFGSLHPSAQSAWDRQVGTLF